MRGYIANTDHDWFDFLSARNDLDVNFWTPSARPFKVVEAGEPVIFRLKSPRNAIGGFGILERFTTLPDWYAWETFGQANGVRSYHELQARLAGIRARNRIEGPRTIGCLVLAQPVFLPREQWVDLPRDWARNIVSGKGYDLAQGEGQRVWQQLLSRAPLAPANGPLLVAEARYGAPRPVAPRLGQAGFRVAVLDAYDRACAVTHEHSLPVLEAAHIRPFAEGGEHSAKNGLLLRSDVHKLFDRGYVTITAAGEFRVSPMLKKHFDNGKAYYALDGQLAALPPDDVGPDRSLLEWHQRKRFLA